MFFKNLTEGVNIKDCPDNDGHNVDAIDALTVSVPVILNLINAPREERNKSVIEAIRVIRNVSKSFEK